LRFPYNDDVFLLMKGETMKPDTRWYVLAWVIPESPSEAAYFVHDGPFATRDAAVATAREVRREDRFVRVIERAEPPTGEAWDEAEEIEP
jgi:hypothetical protein